MRGLLAELPGYAERAGEAKVTNTFGAHDLLVIALCCRLESRYGLRRAMVAAVAGELGRALSGPRPLAHEARLVLGFDPPSVRYVETVENLGEGLVVPLEPVFLLVDSYLLPGRFISGHQRELGLSASIRPNTRRLQASHEIPAKATAAKKKVEQR